MSRIKTKTIFSLITVVAVVALFSAPVFAQEPTKSEKVVTKAQQSFDNFAADPDMSWFRSHLKKAKALLVVPEQLKAGFILGGSGGSGVLLARDTKGAWSQPAFYGMGSGSIGLQIGAQVSEVALLIMTQKGIDALLSTKVQLGGDISVAAGPVGAGAQAATTDVVAFARNKGVFGGISLEGSVISPRNKLNREYYGKEVRPVDILVRRDVNNPQAAPLVTAVTKTAKSGN